MNIFKLFVKKPAPKPKYTVELEFKNKMKHVIKHVESYEFWIGTAECRRHALRLANGEIQVFVHSAEYTLMAYKIIPE